MKFKVVRTMVKNVYHVVADWGDGLYTVVAEIVRHKKDLMLCHVHNYNELTYAQRDEMNVFAKNHITAMKVTERLTR